jgi:hypothetical protein
MKDSTTLQVSNLTLNKDEPPKETKEPHELSIVMYEDENVEGIPDISEIHMNSSSESLSMDSSPLDTPEAATKTLEKSPNFNNPSESQKSEISFESIRTWKKTEVNLTDIPKAEISSIRPGLPVPRLNFSELTAGGKHPIKIFDRKKLSSGKASHFLKEKRTGSIDTSIGQGLQKISEVYNVRLQRAFDMVFLSRVRKEKTEEPSMTFEFSHEEIEISQDEEANFLAGTFGSKTGLFDDKESTENVRSAAGKVLGGKLEKVSLRKKMQAWVRLCHLLH